MRTENLRFGVLLSSKRGGGESDTDVLTRTVAVAKHAETAGIDDVWITEHHFTDSVVSPSSLTLAAFLLGATSRITVGTAVTLLPLHPAVHVAEQALLLGHLSGGRFVLGVGRGQPGPEYDMFGPGIERWRAGLPDALDVLLAALDGTAPTGEAIVPGPTDGRRPPVYLAANSPSSVTVASDRGLPMMLYFDKDADAKANMVALHGAGEGHAFAVYAAVTGSAEEARALMRERATSIAHSAVARTPPPGMPEPSPDEIETYVEWITDRLLASHPVGNVDTCVARLVNEIQESGCRRVLCQFEVAAGTEAALRNVDRFTAEVFPAVRAALPGLVGGYAHR